MSTTPQMAAASATLRANRIASPLASVHAGVHRRVSATGSRIGSGAVGVVVAPCARNAVTRGSSSSARSISSTAAPTSRSSSVRQAGGSVASGTCGAGGSSGRRAVSARASASHRAPMRARRGTVHAGRDCAAARLASRRAAVTRRWTVTSRATCSVWRCRTQRLLVSALCSRSSWPAEAGSDDRIVRRQREPPRLEPVRAGQQACGVARAAARSSSRSASGSSGQNRSCAPVATTTPSAVSPVRQRTTSTLPADVRGSQRQDDHEGDGGQDEGIGRRRGAGEKHGDGDDARLEHHEEPGRVGDQREEQQTRSAPGRACPRHAGGPSRATRRRPAGRGRRWLPAGTRPREREAP